MTSSDRTASDTTDKPSNSSIIPLSDLNPLSPTLAPPYLRRNKPKLPRAKARERARARSLPRVRREEVVAARQQWLVMTVTTMTLTMTRMTRWTNPLIARYYMTHYLIPHLFLSYDNLSSLPFSHHKNCTGGGRGERTTWQGQGQSEFIVVLFLVFLVQGQIRTRKGERKRKRCAGEEGSAGKTR